MLDLTMTQLHKILEALRLLAECGKGGNGDTSALRLADQIDIVIAGRLSEARRLVGAQGLQQVNLTRHGPI